MRKKNAIINSTMAIIQKFIEIILSFIFRTVLIYTLGSTYLGVSSLFTNVFSILSLVELGFGSSIVYLTYKPLKEKDTSTLNAFINLYAKFYTIIGVVVGVVGLLLIPFLPSIIKEYNSLAFNVLPIYLLSLANVVSSYFLAHRRSLLEADQKSYINSVNYSFFNIVGTIVRILVLLFLKNYNLTLFVTLILTNVSNIAIYIQTNKDYPFLKEKNKRKLNKKEKKELIKRMSGATMHQIGNIIVTSTDNIIISSFIGVVVVGLYSNYVMMSNMIYSTFSLIFISITANIGNMKLTETNEKSKDIFDKLQFLNFLLYFIACTIFYSLINDFISLWIGNEYVLDNYIVFVITINLYIMGMRHNIVSFINSSGLNYNTRYKAIIEGILNLIISIILVKYYGIAGVVLGTILSFLFVSVWYEPYVLFKNWLKKGLTRYYYNYIINFILTIVFMLGLTYMMKYIPCYNYFDLFLKLIFGGIFVCIIIVIVYGRTSEFNYYYNIIKKFCLKVIKNEKIK